MSSLIGLLFVIQLPKGLGPLLATGQSKDTSTLFNRYLSTILHVASWYVFAINNPLMDNFLRLAINEFFSFLRINRYKEELLTPNSKAYKSIRLVRSMHKRAGQMMNNQYPLDKIDFEPEMLKPNATLQKDGEKDKPQKDDSRQPLWVNQWDMLLTQWAFVGPLMLEPIALGVHGHNKKSLESVMYLWRVIGHLIGIRPEFNLFTDCDYDLGVARCKLILERIYIPSLTQLPAPDGARMGVAITKGVRYFNRTLCWAALMRKAYSMFNIDASKLNALIDAEYCQTNQCKHKVDATETDLKCPMKAAKDAPCKKKKIDSGDLAANNSTEFQNFTEDFNGNVLNQKQLRQKLLDYGYNDRYEVLEWNGRLLEKVKLRSRRDHILNGIIGFLINTGFKSSTVRTLMRQTAEYRTRQAHKNRLRLRAKCSQNYDEQFHFDQCPFSASFGAMEYLDYSHVLN